MVAELAETMLYYNVFTNTILSRTDLFYAYRLHIKRLMKSEVARCYSVVKEVDKATNAKINMLTARNNVLERRLNRSDILVIGLPNHMENMCDYVIKISQMVGVDITVSDINHCCYIKKQKCTLVKFNSVCIRDNTIKNYHKSQPLMLSSIVSNSESNGIGGFTDVDQKIYLKDNLAPASKKLKYICQKLLIKKKISKFNLINMDNPKAKVHKLDGSVAYLDMQQCADLLDCPVGDEAVIGNV